MAAKKTDAPDLQALLGGRAKPTQPSVSEPIAVEPKVSASAKAEGHFRVTVPLTESQAEQLRILAWFQRKRLKEFYAEAFQIYIHDHQDEIDKAAREYEAAGRPPLEMRGKR